MTIKILSRRAMTGKVSHSVVDTTKDKNTGAGDVYLKTVTAGPTFETKPGVDRNGNPMVIREGLEVYPLYHEAEFSINPAVHKNLETGEGLTVKDAILSLYLGHKELFDRGEMAVVTTPGSVEAIKEAIQEGLPANRVNDDAGLLSSKNKIPEYSPSQELVVDDIKDEEVTGIKDLEAKEIAKK